MSAQQMVVKDNLSKYKITDAQIDPFGFCNAKCWFCPVRYQKNPPHAAKHMPVDVLDKILSELIKEKEEADAPIYTYKKLPVQKGKGRFGPFIKWNNMFINVNKKYDWDNLSDADIVELIETKIQKEIDKVIHNWEDEGIRVEKARWGRHNVLKGKVKVELAKTVDVSEMSLDEAKAIIEANTPKKKAAKKKPTAKKKAPAKKK